MCLPQASPPEVARAGATRAWYVRPLVALSRRSRFPPAPPMTSTLTLFGAPTIERPDGAVSVRVAQGRRVALLAVLALSRSRGVPRDKIIALLWPASPTERARAQLSDDLYLVRTALGDDVILSFGDEIALNESVITSDVGKFEQLLDEGQLEEAVRLFAGAFMDGFYLADSAEFDQWLETQRARLGQRYATALEALAEHAEARGDLAAAVEYWRHLATHDPYRSRTALRLMHALDATGDRTAALRHARLHSALLRDEFEAEPDPQVTALAERLRLEPPAREPVESTIAPAEIVPQGARASTDVTPRPEQRTTGSYTSAAYRRAAVVVLGIALALVVVRTLAARRPAAAPGASSIGVLPFVNMSAAPEDRYFGDGLTEQVITALSRIDGLHVAARTSSFALRDAKLDVRAIGDTLGVAAVLEGSIRRDGNRLRITAQLIDAKTGYHLWAGDYDREIDGILTVQQEIATAIAGALELRLSPDGTAIASRPPPDMQAYDLYLRALYLRNSLAPEALRQAATLLDRALEREPRFALAYAAKASVLAPQILFGHIPAREGTPELRTLTARALELDPSLGEAHATLGVLRLFFDWDWKGAEQALRRAIELNPNDAHAWHHLANYMRATGRFGEAIAARKRAVELDPLNARTVVLLGSDYRAIGDFERALTCYRRALKLEPAHTFALGSGPFLPQGDAEIFAAQGRFAEAAEEYMRIASLRGAKQGEVDALRAAYAASGMPGFWRRWIEMDLRQSEGAPDALRMAKLWTLAGDTGTAVQWLERAYSARHPALIYLRYDLTLAPLRTNPRVVQMLTEMGFPGG